LPLRAWNNPILLLSLQTVLCCSMDVEIESDVLVVGTGGAGLRASIEAHENGASVVAVSKAPAGMSNATMVAGGGFRAALEGLTPKEHFEDTLQVGNYLNDRRLLDFLTKEGSMRVLELQRFGVEMRVTRARASLTPLRPPSTGLGLTKPMVEYLRSKGVTLIANVILSKLLNTREGVIGAVGYDYRNDKPVLFSSKATILATGGAGALYKRTDCPLRTTGDGYSLAYHAGAKLRDMEFVQFVPFALAEPGFPALLMDISFIEEGRILNRLGENIPEKHGITVRPLYTKARGPLSIAIMREIQAGNGVDNAVLLEAGEPIIRLLEESQWYALHPYARIMEKIGALEKPFKIAPVCHFNMGGIVANEDGETAVPGLFGVGEVVGGIHGANRCGGNSLTDITVFGARVGAAAAVYADGRELKKNKFIS